MKVPSESRGERCPYKPCKFKFQTIHRLVDHLREDHGRIITDKQMERLAVLIADDEIEHERWMYERHVKNFIRNLTRKGSSTNRRKMFWKMRKSRSS